MFESVLVITLFVMAVLAPVLIPASIHAAHFISRWRPRHQPGTAPRVPRLAVSRRLGALPSSAAGSRHASGGMSRQPSHEAAVVTTMS
ncbi:hypothetical protein A9X04_02585 [Mycobacterium sp. E3247]|nr:hypothetical protein A9X04_02585 [Mycobacterium sp. E3247]